MDRQRKTAIVLIGVIIPLISYSVTFTGTSYNSLSEASGGKILVLTSFYPLLEFTKEVGKEKVDVQLLVPEGVEPHDWEPTIKDIQRIQTADLVVINGLGFEKYLDDLNSINSQIYIIDTSEVISEMIGSVNPSGDNTKFSIDPHVWLNPKLAKIQVNNIMKGLIDIDPENQKFYKQNAQSYIQKLDELDKRFSSDLKDCRKDFIVLHNAFSYFAEEYSLQPYPILDSNEPHSEPTSKKIENIINLAIKLDIDTIYTERGVDSKITDVIADEIGGNVLVLSPIEIVFEDETYLSLMKQNLENLKRGLCN
ncbi:MAG: zinc ABC transporter solute-binding protein [Nitrosopumilaceae archaeon]|nr:zinc ABC transporter solute-binding protein [Nitrosopumilaceae archaeon]NIT99899.1 zinc ABC transporter solute-binding protein [Nitrosopumilaceae archaeon]NIU86253.1 zinc ABC transporter solute-binding protein [Nitrosopumilaceae archaeon]NIV65008.1 zinc ABC transporter solute-binding protein [Nitrosopumilaceae archaeon]NIX60502.1 zinc ABC transporter solute-binding protein [Nitrosopumilaceae archaeon]